MPTNGKNGKSVVARDEHGRWLKGFSGGPGRPLGSRNKLNEDFLCDLHAAWLERGKNVLDRVIAERPEVFFQAMVKLALVHRVEVGGPKAFDKARTVEEALDQLEGRVGPRGRREFEKFLRRMERLKAEESEEVVDDEDTADLPP
jgi:hypothetical protein